jgi:hypothetical protein
MNLYAYVGNDPLGWRDPTGMQACSQATEEGLVGACIEARNFDPDQDGDFTVISAPDIDRAAREIGPSLEDRRMERASTIDRNEDGSLSAAGVEIGENVPMGQAVGVRPSDSTVAIIHSHPNNQEYSIAPGFHGSGSGDHVAVEAGYPNYIQRQGTTIVLERSGGQYRVRVVGGSLRGGERRQVQRVLNNFQSDSRSRRR